MRSTETQPFAFAQSTTIPSARLLRPAGRDLLLVQPLQRGRFGFGMLVVASIFLGSLPLYWSWGKGNLINTSLKLDAIHDYGNLVQVLLLLPFFIWLTRYYFNRLEPALLTLRQRHVISINDSNYSKFAEASNKLFGMRAVVWAPYVIALAITAYGYLTYWGSQEGTWNSPKTNALLSPVVWLSMLSCFVLYMWVAAFVLRVAVLSGVIRAYFSAASRLTINPLHPDKCGGLSPLGDFALGIAPAGLVVGVAVVIAVFANVYQHHEHIFCSRNIIVVASYIAGLSVAFFMPLLAAREAMLRAKNRTLQVISESCNSELIKALKVLNKDENSETLTIEHIERLTKLYQIADRMPVYPFNTENVLRFFTTILWPVLLMLLKWAYEHFK